MSEENVESFKRAIEAYNRRDVEALLEELSTDVEWHPALEVLLGGEATVYRGHDGIRDLLRGTDEAVREIHVEFSKIRDLGDRIVATGRLRIRGKGSGAETESPVGSVNDYKDGKATLIRTFLDPREALEAAGLSEWAWASGIQQTNDQRSLVISQMTIRTTITTPIQPKPSAARGMAIGFLLHWVQTLLPGLGSPNLRRPKSRSVA